MIDSLRDFLKIFDKASKCIQILLTEPKREIVSTKSEGNLFAQYYKKTTEHPMGQLRTSFHFDNNNCCVFFIEKSGLHGNQFILTAIVNLNQREKHHLYKNRFVRCKQVWNN